jgi:hypothetical protein
LQLPDYQITRLPNLLLVLCVLLIAWQPVSVGLSASRALDSIALGGLPLAFVLTLRLLVAAVGMAAGFALFGLRAGALTLAKVALVVSAATDLFVYLTPYIPSNRAPGETPVFVAASLTYHALWLVYLLRSRRVRAAFENTD